MLEKHLEAKVVKHFKSRGYMVMKFIDGSCIGAPDRMIISPKGDISFIELKTKTGKLSKAQEIYHKRLRNHKQRVYVVNDMSQLEIIGD